MTFVNLRGKIQPEVIQLAGVMDNLKGLLEEYRESPNAESALVIADCFEETGDPRHHLIRKAINPDGAKPSPQDVAAGEDRWEKLIEEALQTYEYYQDFANKISYDPHGLPNSLACSLNSFLDNCEELRHVAPTLTVLDLSKESIFPGDLWCLVKSQPLKDYTGLIIGGIENPEDLEAEITAEEFSPISQLSHLKRLEIQFTGFEAGCFQHLAALKDLQELTLENCQFDGTYDDDLEPIDIAPEEFRHIAQLSQLQRLKITSTLFAEGCLPYFAALNDLRELSLDYCRFPPDELHYITSLPALEVLNLDESSLTDADFSAFANNNRIKKLSLRNTHLNDQALASIASMANLEELDISENTQITNSGLAQLSNLKQLKKLSLASDLNIGGEGLRYLGTLKNLEDLDIRCENITEYGLQQFVNTPDLKQDMQITCSFGSHTLAEWKDRLKPRTQIGNSLPPDYRYEMPHH